MTFPLDAVHNESLQANNENPPETPEGMYRGETVRIIDPSVSLQDAAEELTFAASEGREIEEKKLTERTDPNRQRRMQQVQKLLRCSEEVDNDEVAEIIRKLQTMKFQSPGTLQAAARNAFAKAFDDITLCHAAIYMGYETATDSPELQNALETVLQQMETEHGPYINAGYNIAGIAVTKFTAGDAEKRQVYRDTVLQQQGGSAAFLALVERYGEKDIAGALQFMTTALGADMASLAPSAPPEALKEILEGLETAHTLTTFHVETCRLLHSMETAFGAHKLTPRTLMEPLLFFKDQNQITAYQIRERMPFLESFNPRRDATLTQGAMALAHTLPHAAFAAQESRQQLLDALQVRLDAAVLREDEVAP